MVVLIIKTQVWNNRNIFYIIVGKMLIITGLLAFSVLMRFKLELKDKKCQTIYIFVFMKPNTFILCIKQIKNDSENI